MWQFPYHGISPHHRNVLSQGKATSGGLCPSPDPAWLHHLVTAKQKQRQKQVPRLKVGGLSEHANIFLVLLTAEELFSQDVFSKHYS